MARPLIGVTPDMEFRDGNPPRDWYFMDARTPHALIEAGAAPVLLSHDIALIDTYLDRVDGVFITGGGYQYPDPHLIDFDAAENEPPAKVARARFELELVRRTEERRLPLFAACGGFQLMNVAAGGTIVPALKQVRPEWITHREPWRFDEPAHDVIMTPDSRLRDIVGVERMVVNSRHQQGVVEPGPAARAAAWSPDGVLEAIERPDMPFWLAVQWHPEFHISPGDAKMLEAFVAAAARA